MTRGILQDLEDSRGLVCSCQCKLLWRR